MNILNGNEAFAALMAGKNIMCRAAGELIEFDDLDQFPATVFAMQNYEFCIKRETTVLADIQFTKPVMPHDLEVGQEIYIVMPTCILRTQYDHEHGDICISVANGFAQLDAENAKLQLQAFGKSFGNMITEIEVKDGFNDKPKKTRASRKKLDAPEPAKSISEEHSEPKVEISIETELQLYLDGIKACTSEEEINCTLFDVHRVGFNENQLSEIKVAKECKLVELSLDLNTSQDNQYKNLLNELLEKAEEAKTPVEATALTTYTKSWTEEQRKPLIDAIHKRLNELNVGVEADVQLPSLMVRIQNSKNEHELNELLPEIRSRHPDIQPKLMGYVRARRFELENGPNGAAQ
ncbi:hypothetical protein DJ533_10750 [Acinetobacter defluvii]|uniref:Uncharacterized protein n=1 Tax=Acinetobacter defluvii TaxID=1871111 RepID=A0A2S2FDP1_9GAMM|nr:hypothetical protein [Acinetobacter defluvii]AWL29010.1 hypothetical protein DJ533_10750 [Acinetobacter defluvii]